MPRLTRRWAPTPATELPEEALPPVRDAWFGFTLDGIVAVATWVVLTALAVLLVRAFDLDPYTVGGVVMPIGVGAIVLAAIVALFLKWRSDLLIGTGIGAFSSWVALTMATTLHGSPYGYGLLTGDAGRFVAIAMKSMYTSGSADAFGRGLPSEYPPLEPWIIGHVARVVDRQAWQLFGWAQLVVLTGGIVLAYLLWRRLVSAPVAFTLAGMSTAVFAGPSKEYEFIALVVFTPWVLATFLRLPRARGGLHWLSAGVIGGLLVLTYEAWLFYASVGLVLIILLTLRDTPARAGYLLRLLGVALTALVVSSWYVIPFAYALVTTGGERVSDLWMSASISDHPMLLQFFGATPLAVIQLIGLFGMVWYRRSTWWAQPMLMMVLGAYAYRIAYLVRTAIDNHTGYLQYTETLVSMLLMVAGVLTIARAVPQLWARLSVPSVGRFPREQAVALTAIVAIVAWSFVQGWPQWVPGPRGLRDSVTPVGEVNRASDVHAEPLPDGSLVRFAPPAPYVYPRFPSTAIARVVSAQLGPKARPVVLAYDQTLFAFEPYYAYNAVDRLSANTVLQWDVRTAEIKKLAAITDPAAFAHAADTMRFDPIDVFVLHVGGSHWQWLNVGFSPASFDSRYFHIEQLPDATIIAVRKR